MEFKHRVENLENFSSLFKEEEEMYLEHSVFYIFWYEEMYFFNRSTV